MQNITIGLKTIRRSWIKGVVLDASKLHTTMDGESHRHYNNAGGVGQLLHPLFFRGDIIMDM